MKPKNSYNALGSVAALHRIGGIILMAVGILIALSPFVTGKGDPGAAALVTVGMAAWPFFSGLVLVAIGELLMLAIHVAQSISVIEQTVVAARAGDSDS